MSELMLNIRSTHYDPTNSFVDSTRIYDLGGCGGIMRILGNGWTERKFSLLYIIIIIHISRKRNGYKGMCL
jgi:hypothetical protein